MLVALADRCNKDTLRCDPSIKRLAEDTGMDERTVSRALADLENDGFIEKVQRQRENGSTRSNEFRFPGVTVSSPPRHSAPLPPGTVTPPEPELRTRTRTKPIAAAPRPSDYKRITDAVRKSNEAMKKIKPSEMSGQQLMWDVLSRIFGEPTTKTAMSIRGRVCRSLWEAGASQSVVLERAKRWPAHFDGATMTDLALEKHWDTLGRKPLRRR